MEVLIHPWEGAIFLEGENGRPIVKYRDTLRSSVQRWLNRYGCRLGCELGWPVGIMFWMGVHRCRGMLPWQPILILKLLLTGFVWTIFTRQLVLKGYFWGEGASIVKYRDALQSSVQKRLNQSRCRLGVMTTNFGTKIAIHLLYVNDSD